MGRRCRQRGPHPGQVQGGRVSILINYHERPWNTTRYAREARARQRRCARLSLRIPGAGASWRQLRNSGQLSMYQWLNHYVTRETAWLLKRAHTHKMPLFWRLELHIGKPNHKITSTRVAMGQSSNYQANPPCPVSRHIVGRSLQGGRDAGAWH